MRLGGESRRIRSLVAIYLFFYLLRDRSSSSSSRSGWVRWGNKDPVLSWNGAESSRSRNNNRK
jgi:hypothetical protein